MNNLILAAICSAAILILSWVYSFILIFIWVLTNKRLREMVLKFGPSLAWAEIVLNGRDRLFKSIIISASFGLSIITTALIIYSKFYHR